MYCLAPLSAIDLKESNATSDNNQTIDDNNDKEIVIPKETDKTDDNCDEVIANNITNNSEKEIDVANKNMEELNDAKEIDVANKNMEELNDTENSTEKHYSNLTDPDLRMDLEKDNILVGEKLVVEIHTNESIDHHVYLCGYNQDYSEYFVTIIDIKKGYAKTTIDKDLPSGNYTIGCTFCGAKDKGFDDSSVDKEFKVKKINPDLRIRVSDFMIDEHPYAVISTNRTFSGDVTVKLNNSNNTYIAKPVDGECVVNFKNLAAGNYTATASYEENRKYDSSEDSTSFKVEKYDPNLSIDVENNTIHDKTNIEVHANARLCEPVHLKLSNSKEYTIKLENGSGNVTIDNLGIGKYSATLSYDGDKYFNPGEKTIQFAKMGDPNLSMDVEKMGYDGTTAKITVHANESLNGDVKVKIKSQHDNDEATVKIVNGVGETTFDSLTMGDTYNATATFDGNDIISAGSANISFKVSRRL